jgi:hypothetical protein
VQTVVLAPDQKEDLMKSSYRFVALAAAASAVLAPAAAAGATPQPASSWATAIQVPGPGVRGMADIFSMSCASAGKCAAGGDYLPKLGTEGFVAVERNGQWGKAIEVPGLGALNKRHDAYTSSVSCAPAGDCAAVGNYNGRSGHQGFVTVERNGGWSKAIEIPGLAALNKGGAATVFSVSCVPAGNCAAVGNYADRSHHEQGFAADERNGRWAKAIEIPGLGALNKGGHAFISSVSCASSGNCAAVGSYSERSGHQQGFAANERNGRWGKAFRIGGLGAVDSVSCASAGNCGAGGGLFVISERNGRWGNAIQVPGLQALNTGGKAFTTSVSCGSAGNCAAGGSYRDLHHRGHAFVVSEQNGRWGNAIQVPDLSKLNLGGLVAGTNWVSCASAGSCAAGGTYTDGSGHEQGFVVSEQDGRWGNAIQVPGLVDLRHSGLMRPGRKLRGHRALPGQLRRPPHVRDQPERLELPQVSPVAGIRSVRRARRSAQSRVGATGGRNWQRLGARCPGTGYRPAGVAAASTARVAFLCARPAGTRPDCLEGGPAV